MKITQVTHEEMLNQIYNHEDASKFWAIISFEGTNYNAVGGFGYRVKSISSISVAKMIDLKNDKNTAFIKIEEDS